MSKKQKKVHKSSTTGRFVSPEYADLHEDETFVQSITIGQKKYEEACLMLEQLKVRTSQGPTAAGRNYTELLEWLLEDGEKPKIH